MITSPSFFRQPLSPSSIVVLGSLVPCGTMPYWSVKVCVEGVWSRTRAGNGGMGGISRKPGKYRR